MLKLCRDKECLTFGIALPEKSFPRNRYYDTGGLKDGLGIYCKACARRRTREYRENLRTLAFRTRVRIPKDYQYVVTR